MNPKNLLEQFLGGNALQKLQNAGQSTRQQLDGFGGPGFAGGAVAGSLLGLMLGNKKMRKMTGGLFSYGMAAGAGALAYQAYRNWQQGVAPAAAPAPTSADIANIDRDFLPENATA